MQRQRESRVNLQKKSTRYQTGHGLSFGSLAGFTYRKFLQALWTDGKVASSTLCQTFQRVPG
jgi:hypothetical protein